MSTTTAAGVLRPSRSERTATLRKNLVLVREIAWTQFKLKYTGSVLGYLWSLLKPAAYFGVLYVIFVKLIKFRADEFPLQLLVGIVLFTFFTECTNVGLGSIVGNGGLIQKAYFPRAILVVASSMTAAMTFVINFVLIVAIATPLGHLHLGLRTLAVVPLVLELYVLSLGLSLLLSSLFVFYRDLGHIWEILGQVIFYASAVVFPIAIVPVSLRAVFFSNPLAQIIEDVRHALVVSDIPSTFSLIGAVALVPIGISLGLFVVGALVFRTLSPSFAENL
ncbi:MAG: ABC transporter permease [Candidatus Dormibacteraeota bacterium]|nr:ABC transporter permease [Candidatus Dormibacteraeota bacterium]